MKHFSSLNELTLLMPTFNREKYAERSISFWSNTNVNLIVLDGSKNPLQNSFIGKLPRNIMYLHNHDSWIDRMVLGSSLSKTPFTMLICDDEFYLPSALNSLLNELKFNTEINSVTGLTIAFYPFANNIYFRRMYKSFKNASVDLDNPEKRVEYHMNPYAVTGLYGMNRTNVFKKNIEIAKICSSLPDPASFELGFEIANSYQGKSKVLPLVSWLRSMENPPIWNTKSIQTHVWWSRRNENNLLIDVSRVTESVLRTSQDFEDKLDNQILYIGLGRYVSNFDYNKNRLINFSIFSQFKKLIKFFLPYRVYFFFIWLTLLCFKNSNLTEWQMKNTLLEQLKIENINISINDLNEINKFIHDH